MTIKQEKLSKRQLLAIAKEHKIKNFTEAKKSQLIKLLERIEIKTIPELAPLPSKKYQHGKTPYSCKECGGNAIYEHNRRKAKCIECGGS